MTSALPSVLEAILNPEFKKSGNKISSGETETYPGILYHSKEGIVRNCFGGSRIRLAVVVMVTLT